MTFYSEKTIYEHTDSDGDSLRVAVTPISVRFYREGPNEYAGLDRYRVLELHEALVGWLYPNHTSEAPNHSLIEQMIERAVKDQITAILPLHLSLKSDAERAREAKDGSEQCRGGYGCDTLGVHAAYGSCCGRPDPEPHDVGHPVPVGFGVCECGHAANFHSEDNGCCHWYTGDQEFCDCTRGLGGLGSDAFPEDDPESVSRCYNCQRGSHPHVFKPCGRGGCECRDTVPETDPEPRDVGHPTYEDAKPHPEDSTYPARQVLPVGPMHCTICGHHRTEHMGVLGGCWGDQGCCACTNNPEAPVPVTESDKVWGEQGEPPAPVALECVCDKHNHRPVVREGSPATCAYRNCGCGYRSTP